MSTADEVLTSPSILTPRQRRKPVVLAEDPTDEKPARDWTLSEADRAEVLRCRTNHHRLSFAIQLCVLRAHGHFLADYEAVGVRITNHLPSARSPARPVRRPAPTRGHRPRARAPHFCLSLLSNAVLVWNAVRRGGIVALLRAAGEAVSDE